MNDKVYDIATSKEQSERLLKCGVPSESADMFRWSNSYGDEFLETHYKPSPAVSYTPAWSVSRLLQLLPSIVESRSVLPETYALILMPKDNGCVVSYANKKLKYITYVTEPIVEACVQTIEWLTAHSYKLNEI